MAEMKKNILTEEGLKALEDELQDLKVNRRKEVAQKIKEAREQGDLSENAEYDAAKEEQRDIELRIEEIDKTFTPCCGLKMGTIFPELVSPYVPCQSMEEDKYIRETNRIGKGCNKCQ